MLSVMTITAAIKFVQGATIGTPGIALVGSTGIPVVASDGNASLNNGRVIRYVWTMLDVPALSVLTRGELVSGPISSITFTPDVAGDYHLQLDIYALDGSRTRDRRVFRILLPSGRAIPAFEAEADALNFSGNDRGWAPDMEAWFAAVEAGSVGGFGGTIANASSGTLNNVSSLDGGVYAGGIRFTGSPTLTGIASGADRRWIAIHAIAEMTLANESASSTASNRIVTGSGSDLTLAAGSGAILVYDPTAARWRVISANTNPSGGPFISNSSSGTLNNVSSGSGIGVLFTAGPSVTGLSGGAAGRRITLGAAGATLTLKHESGTSTASNRIDTGHGLDLVIADGGSVVLVYDTLSSRWMVEGASTTAGIQDLPIDVNASPPIGASTSLHSDGRMRLERAAPWVSVLHYDADPTGVADSSAAFKAAHDALTGAGAKGGTVFMPEGSYRLDADFILARNVSLQGAGATSGNGGTMLNFAAGKKLLLAGFANGQTYPSPSTAQGSRLKDFGILKNENARIASTPWNSLEAVTVGTKRIRVGAVNEMDDERFAYLECIVAGTTSEVQPHVPAHPDEFSAPFVPGKTYYLGELVRGTNDGAVPNATGSNLIDTHLFKVIVEGVAGGSHPTWNTSGTTVSGGVTFLAISSADFWVFDGDVTWAARSDAGILSFCKVAISDLHIEGAGGPGIHLRGNSNGGVVTNCNGWTIFNTRIVHCGIGVMPHGGDAQAGVGCMIDVEGAGYKMPAGGGYGIYDASGVGNLWLGCQVANVPSQAEYDPNGGGSHSYIVSGSGLSAACFVNCYSEGYGGLYGSPVALHLPSVNVKVIGGAHSAGFTDSLYPARDGSKTEAEIMTDPGQGGSKGSVWRTSLSYAQYQNKTGTEASITEVDVGSNNARNPINGNVRVTGLAGISSSDTGRVLILSGCGFSDYDGQFAIASVATVTATVASATFAEVGATGDTITRSTGDFIADGFVPGHRITVTGTTLNNFVDAKITAVTSTVLTLDTQDLVAEVSACTITAKDVYVVNRKSTHTTQDANNGAITWTIGGGYVTTYLGTRDGNGAVIQWAAHDYGSVDRYQLLHSSVLSDGGGWPGVDWWAFTSQGLKSRVWMAVPGLGATYGADQAPVDDFGPHFPTKIWFGNPADYLRSVEYGTAAPTTLRHAPGSICFNKNYDGSLNTPIAWICKGVGTPGTWRAIYAARAGRLLKAIPDADTSVTAAEMCGSIKVTGTLAATRTLTIPHPASEDQTIGFDFINACTGASVVVSTGTGTTVTVGVGQRVRLEASPDGITSIASYTVP